MGMEEFRHETMIAAPAGVAAARAIYTSEDGILQCYGTTVPTDGDTGFAPSCQFQKIDGTTLDTVLYVNIGTLASCNFDAALLAS